MSKTGLLVWHGPPLQNPRDGVQARCDPIGQDRWGGHRHVAFAQPDAKPPGETRKGHHSDTNFHKNGDEQTIAVLNQRGSY